MPKISKYCDSKFFDRDVQVVAKDLLGRVIEHLVDNVWLSVRIIETEAYYGEGEKGTLLKIKSVGTYIFMIESMWTDSFRFT